MRLKRPRVKDDGYLAFIRELPCCICKDNTSTEAAHLRMGGLYYGKRQTGWGKPSDLWVTPLCSEHHRLQHDMGEGKFWDAYKIDPFVLCLSLKAAEYDYETAELILERQGWSK